MNNKRIFTLILLLVCNLKLYSQESFMSLDSIKVIRTELFPTYNYQSSICEATDTLTLNVGLNQIVVVRSTAMSITAKGNADYIFSNNSHRIYDARISINEFNVFTTLELAPPSSFSDFVGSYSDRQLKTKGFKGIAKNDILLPTGSHETLVYFKALGFIPDVIYRIELVYYSY